MYTTNTLPSIILYTKIISDNIYFVSKTNFLTKRKKVGHKNLYLREKVIFKT